MTTMWMLKENTTSAPLVWKAGEHMAAGLGGRSAEGQTIRMMAKTTHPQ